MSEWNTFIADVQNDLASLEEAGCDTPFFRGYSSCEWKLLCGLGRQSPEEFKKKNIETILYYDYMSHAGPLLDDPHSSWDVLFSMQHHGLPTRLLDWTLTFSVALYFSIKKFLFLKDFPELTKLRFAPCVWVLDPYELNRATAGEAVVLNPHTDLEGTYQATSLKNPRSSARRLWL